MLKKSGTRWTARGIENKYGDTKDGATAYIYLKEYYNQEGDKKCMHKKIMKS